MHELGPDFWFKIRNNLSVRRGKQRWLHCFREPTLLRRLVTWEKLFDSFSGHEVLVMSSRQHLISIVEELIDFEVALQHNCWHFIWNLFFLYADLRLLLSQICYWTLRERRICDTTALWHRFWSYLGLLLVWSCQNRSAVKQIFSWLSYTVCFGLTWVIIASALWTTWWSDLRKRIKILFSLIHMSLVSI